MARQPVNPEDLERIEAEKRIGIARRLLRIEEAKRHLIPFIKLTMPHPDDPGDPLRSRYEDQYFHRALAAALEEVECGNITRLIVTFPPRHGKSEQTTRRLPAWLIGRDPYREVIVATYNQPFAETFGKKVREIINSPMYQQIFPAARLAKGGQSAAELTTTEGGQLAFVGRGGSATGRGADVLIIDDPLKDRAEANSAATREELWDWFNDTISSRLKSDTGAIIIIQTRWHEDDLIGRLIDPENPCYNEDEARQWKIIEIRAIAEEDDVLGRPLGAPLWPERFGLEYLESFRRRNPKGFASLFQQRPTPEDGDLFTKEMIVPYQIRDLPKRLRIYAASDHAVEIKQENDYTVLIVAGVDEYGTIWILDCWREKARADKVVERMLDMGRKWKPLIWWAEQGHISKAIGPFLRKRMREERVYFRIDERHPAGDKVQRSQSIQGRMAQGLVRFPQNAPWFEAMKAELLKFPQARHDDMVDALAHLGLGLDRILKASKPKAAGAVNDNPPPVGTLRWVKWASVRERQASERQRRFGGL